MNNNKCPVCGMEAKPDIKSAYQGQTYYFCCPVCKDNFDKEPQKYAK